jgi:MoaA/NifB/PqqE/SkfB family radical SAM enzyme
MQVQTCGNAEPAVTPQTRPARSVPAPERPLEVLPLDTEPRRYRKPLTRRLREWRGVLYAWLSKDHVIQAHVVPMRRCNLSCAYCNEFDDYSQPVPLEEMLRRIDKLAALGTSLVTISGGEPLLHPDLDDIIYRIRKRGMLAGLITNGYLLVRERIERLNRARLDFLQISIDNVQPDDVSMKSLKVLDRKLILLARYAKFDVNINSVVGSGVRSPEDALMIARRAVELGFISTVGIIHDGHGQLRPLNEREHSVYEQVKRLGKRHFARYNRFQDHIAQAMPFEWKCRAGARYLYICEKGLVHYCSQQRGYPGVPLAEYTVEDIRREYRTAKACAPYCTVACAHYTSLLDEWRDPQSDSAVRLPAQARAAAELVQIE